MISRPLFVFAPGAGADSSHPWMQHWNRLLANIGEVIRFDYPYMREGRGRPDPLPRLIEAHRNVVTCARMQVHGGPVVLIGKSMGGRVGCHVATIERVEAVVCLGYPLCGAGTPMKLRDQILRVLATPILFVQGTRDPLCPLELLEQVRKEMTARTALHVVEGGDHSLRVGKRQLKARALTQDAVDQEIAAQIAKFVDGNVSTAQRSV
jgi:predicted alpha/beta-hydrolase family hydrolase